MDLLLKDIAVVLERRDEFAVDLALHTCYCAWTARLSISPGSRRAVCFQSSSTAELVRLERVAAELV